MLDKRLVCEKYIKQIGRNITIVYKDGREQKLSAVLQAFWRSSKTHYQELQTPVGRSIEDYFHYIGPASCDVTQLTDEDYVVCGDEKYYFIKAQPTVIGDRIQFYTGTIKRIREDDFGVLN